MLGFLSRQERKGLENARQSGSDNTAEATFEEYKDERLEKFCFQYPLRGYQKEILNLVLSKYENGERELHVVAPPGAGKTIIGLQIVSLLKYPALILCPNTTIQSQWGHKLNLFIPPELVDFGSAEFIGTHEDKPLKPITVLTYQVLSTPGREQEYIEKLAYQSWVDELTGGRAISGGEAELRIVELMQNNKKAYARELSRHVSRLRRKLSEVLDLNDVLHPNALELLQTLRRQKFRTVIFDECHHLTDYWAAIMTHLIKYLDDPIVIGLTGTPPEGKSATQENRYMSLVGEIDYQVPTPALVKEGGLAPFQDLVYFAEPTPNELYFLERQHDEFHRLIEELTTGRVPEPMLELIDDEEGVNKQEAEKPITGTDEYEEGVGLIVFDGQKATTIEGSANGNEHSGTASDTESDTASGSGTADDDSTTMKAPLRTVSGASAAASGTTAPVAGTTYEESGTTAPAAGTTHSGPATPAAAAGTTSEKPPETPLTSWIKLRLNESVYAEDQKAWQNFSEQKPQLAAAFYRYLWKARLPLPRNIAPTDEMRQSPVLEDWMHILEDFAAHRLKLSSASDDHLLFDRIRSAARKLGYGFTEQGVRKQASPVDRVLAFSKSKQIAVQQILDIEYRNLQDRLRAVVVTDFERMSATAVKNLKGVLDEESGGAISTLRTLLEHDIAQYLNPCLVTGSLLLTDKRITSQFVAAAQALLKEQGHTFELMIEEEDHLPFSAITASSGAWQSRLYVGLATTIFERGITKCLIGTRGLFGEGWDSQALNTLIDLTTTTSPVSVKQLRGRSLRIQTNDPLGGRKVANNWDVVCIAPHLEKGLNDYMRFVRKHDGYFGISDDGQIESGVGHVHPAFSELTPAEVFASISEFNSEMVSRALVRDKIYELWKVGQPYHNRSLGCVEVMGLRKLALTPPHIRKDLKYTEHAAELRHALYGVIGEYGGLGAACSIVIAFLSMLWAVPLAMAGAPLALAAVLGYRRYADLYSRMRADVCRPNTQESSLKDIATAVLTSMQRVKLLPQHVSREYIKITVRSDGRYRVFLDDVEPAQSRQFVQAFREVMAPVSNEPYTIPKYEYSFPRPSKSRSLSLPVIFKRSAPPEFEIDPAQPSQESATGKSATGNSATGKSVKSRSATDNSRASLNSGGRGKGKGSDNSLPSNPAVNESRFITHEEVIAENPLNTQENPISEAEFFQAYLKGKAQPRVASYHPVPKLLARSSRGRKAFQAAWNKYVSPGFILETAQKPDAVRKYFGLGPSLAQRLLWE